MADESKEENMFEHFMNIDVSKHVQKKMGLSYLSWSWVWIMIKQYDFNANKHFTKFDEIDLNNNDSLTGRKVDYCKTDTGTYVECTVTIKGHSETESLYVMDNKNNAVLKPNQAQINKAKQRCFVKCCALFGLGISLYAGEDLPNDSKDNNYHKSNYHANSSHPASDNQVSFIKALYKRANLPGNTDSETIKGYDSIGDLVKQDKLKTFSSQRASNVISFLQKLTK